MAEIEYLGMPISEERGYGHAAAIMAALERGVALESCGKDSTSDLSVERREE